MNFKIIVASILLCASAAHAEVHKYACVLTIMGQTSASPDLTVTRYDNPAVIQAQRDGFQAYNLLQDSDTGNVFTEPSAEEGDTPETFLFTGKDFLDIYKGQLKISHCVRKY